MAEALASSWGSLHCCTHGFPLTNEACKISSKCVSSHSCKLLTLAYEPKAADTGVLTAVPRVVRDALVSWDRQDYPLPNIMDTLNGGAGKLFERTFDLGEP